MELPYCENNRVFRAEGIDSFRAFLFQKLDGNSSASNIFAEKVIPFLCIIKSFCKVNV
jgi:hypothetical protein